MNTSTRNLTSLVSAWTSALVLLVSSQAFSEPWNADDYSVLVGDYNRENTNKHSESKGANCACCFVGGTQVLTKEGLRPIEQLRPGALVASRNEDTGEVTWKPVANTFIFDDDRLSYELILTTADGEEQSLEVTHNHPFWVRGIGWVDSVDLEPGQYLESYTGANLTVKSLTALNRSPITYNIEVEDFHTYFVGNHLAWVRNMCKCGDGSSSDSGHRLAIKSKSMSQVKQRPEEL